MQRQLAAQEEAARVARDREAQLREREVGALQQAAEAKQLASGVKKQFDALQSHARELLEGLRSAGRATARCIIAVGNTATSLQRKQAQQVSEASLGQVSGQHTGLMLGNRVCLNHCAVILCGVAVHVPA